jgi:hypothetical protein
MNDFIEVDQYTAIKMEDGGQYGFKLLEGYVDKAGEFKPSFCKRQFGKDRPEKVAPISVKLGDAEHAAAALKLLLTQLDVPF